MPAVSLLGTVTKIRRGGSLGGYWCVLWVGPTWPGPHRAEVDCPISWVGAVSCPSKSSSF